VDPDREAVLKTFATECEESFLATENALVALEISPNSPELVETIFRAMHTLKGNAFSLGFSEVSELAHAVEDVLERIRAERLPVTSALVTLLLGALDVLREAIPEAIAEGGAAGGAAQRDMLAALRRAADEGAAPAARTPAAPPAQPSGKERRARPFGRRREDFEAWSSRSHALRVDTRKLDRMLDLSGEAGIALGHLRRALAQLGGPLRQEILDLHQQAERIQQALQEEVMRVRMVAIGPVFRQFVRIVRDVAGAAGKPARVELMGEDVEVDVTVVEHLRDPLIHMVRNAIDHGLEDGQRRREAGKDPVGRIVLRAFHDAGSVVVQVEDDGAGFSFERIAAKARERGLLAESEKGTSQELVRFVFQPGFSTAERVSDLSGRGVGLDVVARSVEMLHGSVQVSSRPGAGSTVTLRLPLTVAIIDGLGIGAGGESFVLPLDSVIECIDLPPKQRASDDAQGVLDLRGDPVPYFRLSDALGLPRTRGARENVVVVRHEEVRAGIAVDSLDGESQTVIKPLGRLFQSVPGISGSAVLASGRVALILDVPDLLRQVLASQAGAPPGPA
jgi:two-component system chemotaxis sensor kinase CheA